MLVSGGRTKHKDAHQGISTAVSKIGIWGVSCEKES